MPKKQHKLDDADEKILNAVGRVSRSGASLEGWAEFDHVHQCLQCRIPEEELKRRIWWLNREGYLQKTRAVVEDGGYLDLLRVVDPTVRLTKIALKNQKES